MIRDALIFGDDDRCDETPIRFHERTGHRLHLYPGDPCQLCGFWLYAVEPETHEAWCLKCAADAPPDS